MKAKMTERRAVGQITHAANLQYSTSYSYIATMIGWQGFCTSVHSLFLVTTMKPFHCSAPVSPHQWAHGFWFLNQRVVIIQECIRTTYNAPCNYSLHALRRTGTSSRNIGKINFFAIKLSTREQSATFHDHRSN